MNTAKQPLMFALRLNALFSATSAVMLVIAGGWIARQLGLASPALVYIVAAGLLLFALQLSLIVRSRRIRNWEIIGIICGDLAWVVASVVMVSLFHESLTTTGLLLVDVVALVVLVFAILQIRGLRYFQQLA